MDKHEEVFQKARQDYADALTADIERNAADKQREWNQRGGEPRLLVWKNRLKRSLARSR
jgi:hypothetical protein